MPPEPPYKFVSSLPKRPPPPQEKSWLRACSTIFANVFLFPQKEIAVIWHCIANSTHSTVFPPKILIRSRRFSFRKQMLKRARFCLAKDLLNSKLRQRISLCLSNQLVWVTRSHTQQDNTGNKVTQATG